MTVDKQRPAARSAYWRWSGQLVIETMDFLLSFSPNGIDKISTGRWQRSIVVLFITTPTITKQSQLCYCWSFFLGGGYGNIHVSQPQNSNIEITFSIKKATQNVRRITQNETLQFFLMEVVFTKYDTTKKPKLRNIWLSINCTCFIVILENYLASNIT